jgi:hypothetical protein
MADHSRVSRKPEDEPPTDSAAGPDYFNTHGRLIVPHPLPQFPATLAGQSARLELQEWVEAQRVREARELSERLKENSSLLRELREQHTLTPDPAARAQASEIAAIVANATARAVTETFMKLGLVSAVTNPPAQEAETPAAEPQAEPENIPSDPAWRVWETFRKVMQDDELEIRHPADGINALGTRSLPKWRMAERIGCSVKTITRGMEFHGLNPRRDWPPSTWPEQAPPKQLRMKGLQGETDTMASMAAGVALVWGALDFLSDGRLDGIVNICHLLFHGTKHLLI